MTAAISPWTLPHPPDPAGGGGATTVDEISLWDDLVRDHGARVYRLAYALTRNRYDAEDLQQDVFDRAFRNLGARSPGNLDGWLYRVTVNLFRDQLRRKRRIRLEPLSDDTLDRHTARHPGPEESVTGEIFDSDVRSALSALHPDVRVAVLLCDVDGLTYDEIAAVLGVNRGTVGSRIHRGRAQLRIALAQRRPRRAALAVSRGTAA